MPDCIINCIEKFLLQTKRLLLLINAVSKRKCELYIYLNIKHYIISITLSVQQFEMWLILIGKKIPHYCACNVRYFDLRWLLSMTGWKPHWRNQYVTKAYITLPVISEHECKIIHTITSSVCCKIIFIKAAHLLHNMKPIQYKLL